MADSEVPSGADPVGRAAVHVPAGRRHRAMGGRMGRPGWDRAAAYPRPRMAVGYSAADTTVRASRSAAREVMPSFGNSW